MYSMDAPQLILQSQRKEDFAKVQKNSKTWNSNCSAFFDKSFLMGHRMQNWVYIVIDE